MDDFNFDFDIASILPQEAFESPVPSDSLVVHDAENIPMTDKYSVPPFDVLKASEKSIEDFNTACFEEGLGYEAPNFPLWSEKLEGLMNGFYIIAGYSNSGKSALAMNIALDYAMHPDNKLFLIYYSLDDTKLDIMSRILAMRKHIPISVARKPKRYQEKVDNGEDGSSIYSEQLKARAEGLEELKEASKHFIVVDTEEIDCIEKIENHAKTVKQWLQARDPEMNIIVVIDSLMDINIDSKNFREEKDLNTQRSKLVKKLAYETLKCPVFGTAHVKKNSGRRVTIADLKESGRYEYDARAVFLVTNDVSRNGQNADIYYTVQNSTEKFPVLEIYWAKNKASSFKERTYCYFSPDLSLARECSKKQTQEFDTIIYGE